MSTIAEKLRNAANVVESIQPNETEVLSIEMQRNREAVKVHIWQQAEFIRIVKAIKADTLWYKNQLICAIVDGVEWLYVADNDADTNAVLENLNLPMRVRT